MADGERDEAERPAQADRQHAEHQDRLPHAHEGEDHHEEGQGEGQHGGNLAVAEGGRHLVVGEHRRPRDPGLDGGVVRVEAGDGAADGVDRLVVSDEAALLPLGRLHEDEQQALVLREEVAGVGGVAEGEEGGPRRAVRRGAIEPRRDLIQQHPEEAGVHRQVLVVEPEVEEVGDEGRRHLGVDALDQPRQARVPREALHELLVVEDLVPDLLELGCRQVEELAALELLGVDPEGDAMELQRRSPQLLHQAGGERLGALQRARLDHHHDVLQLAEVLGDLHVALHVTRVLGQDIAAGGLEAQRVQRVGDPEDGQGEGERHRQDRARARHPDQAAKQATGSRDDDHGTRRRKLDEV